MSRTQVKEIPSRGVTYKQLLKKQEKHSERLYDEYQRYVFVLYTQWYLQNRSRARTIWDQALCLLYYMQVSLFGGQDSELA